MFPPRGSAFTSGGGTFSFSVVFGLDREDDVWDLFENFGYPWEDERYPNQDFHVFTSFHVNNYTLHA